MTQSPSPSFARHIAILILLGVGCTFASAHIAARISFDHGTGLLTAVIFRSALTMLLLGVIVIWSKQNLLMSWRLSPWQLMLGLMISIQSISIYSAVSRIPVGIALLVVNTFPAQLALITWALGGKAPSRRTAFLMVIILLGLLLALDIPSLIQAEISDVQQWTLGVSFALLAAFAFAIGLWVTENKLKTAKGGSRSFYAMLTVLIVSSAAGQVGIIPDGLNLPADGLGWAMLLLLSGLYATGFITFFTLAPRLTLAQNAPAMNIEPIASLFLGWVILGQQLNSLQMIGGAVVVSGIVALSYTKQ